MAADQLVLVDESDVAIGSIEKMKAHSEGLLHRAFSIFLFDDDGRMLLQRRALTKYHSAGLWSNACCGHPRTGEQTAAGARRRLQEELGIDSSLNHLGSFRYRAELENGLVEHEIDHVFVGRHNGSVDPNPAEVADWEWIDLDTLAFDLSRNGSRYTPWFGLAVAEFDLISANPSDGRLFIPANQSQKST
jgi:isopentenyl-diphosphate delta-isomerase